VHKRCLIIGAGEAGRSLARSLRRSPDLGLAPVGFLDDDRTKVRWYPAALPVLGRIADLPVVAEAIRPDLVVIAIPSLPAAEVRHIGEQALAVGLSVRYLPSFVAALERDVRAGDLRNLQLDHQIGRAELQVVRRTSRSVVAGKRVLVTGAGGSIGSELCRQIKAFRPSRLYLLDHDESNLHRLQMALTGEALLDDDDVIIADIRDESRIHQLFRDLRPDVVFHAAAHKHLPLLERHPCEGVKSNVLGTMHVVEAAVAIGAERFILISTDKAADPTSVLGATKRVAEMIVQSYVGCDTRLASVRFGNVLGSRGSFLSVLSEQIENGEEITVTDPDVTRFFMTIEEAAGLVLEAAEMADEGEIFVLDMGEPVRIVDLVLNYAAEVHLDLDRVSIRYTGLRPGEKLNEALFGGEERRVHTGHPRIYAALPVGSVGRTFDAGLAALLGAATANREDLTRRRLTELLPDYTPAEEADRALALAAPYPDGF
jgi:FlaA1/EpsC-like NDP-sugar epimerase